MKPEEVEMAFQEAGQAAATSSELVLRGSERKWLIGLSFGLGFSQGCALCFYVGAGSYFSAAFDNSRFFVDACAFFYLPPILVTLAQLLLDHQFDALLGIRPVLRFRIIFSSLVVALMLSLMGFASHPRAFKGDEKIIFGIGILLGSFAAVLLGSSCVLFGAVDPRFVPYLVLGQTAAGVYTNVAARVLGFEPGCSIWRSRAFFWLATGTVLLITVAYQVLNSCKLLDRTYQHHEDLLSTTLSQTHSSSVLVDVGAAAADSDVARRPWRPTFGFPPLCWAMAACQTIAIAMNMSLTPLSNQIARGQYDVAQELLLAKLLADFVGRALFLVIPAPSRDTGWGLRKIRGQAVLVWLVELCRLPIWFSIFIWALGSDVPSFLANKEVLLWPIWLPFISSGALSASWCFVIAVTAAPEDKKRAANLLMSFSVYAGFSVGIVVAKLTG